MIRRTQRPLLPEEQASALRGLPLLDSAFRRLAKAEASAGQAEVLEFDVARAWNIISCEGPPCCPNWWLLKADGDEFVYLSSWEHLRAVREAFPGSRVRIELLPLTGRILTALAEGPPVPAAELPLEANAHLPRRGRSDCAVFMAHASLHEVLGAPRP